jgi:Xaa-Pro aminopeptidase
MGRAPANVQSPSPPAESSFQRADRDVYDSRIRRLREALRSDGFAALFVPPSSDLEYLFGEPRPAPTPTSSTWPLAWITGAWVLAHAEPVLTVPRMAADYSFSNDFGWPLVVLEDDGEPLAVLRKIVADLDLGGKRIGLGDKALARLALDLQKVAPSATVLSEPTFAQRVRAPKDETELAIMRQVCRITDAAFANLVAQIRPGLTERDVVDELTFQLRALGSMPAYPIGAWGWGPTYPRTRWNRVPMTVPVTPPNVFAFDFGAWWNGHTTDFCRVVHLSDPGPEIRQMYRDLVEVQEFVISELKPDGRTGQDIYRIGMSRMRDFGLDRYFPDRFGHGIGMDTHEVPSLLTGDTTPLVAGMVVTIEPQVFKGPVFLGIEDLVLVDEEGGQKLTLFGSEQIIVR